MEGPALEFPRGSGILEVKILEAKYEAKLNFLGGGGKGKTRNLLWGKYGYFLELHAHLLISINGLNFTVR